MNFAFQAVAQGLQADAFFAQRLLGLCNLHLLTFENGIGSRTGEDQDDGKK